MKKKIAATGRNTRSPGKAKPPAMLLKKVRFRAKPQYDGKKTILIGVSLQDWNLLREAAALEMRPITGFVLYHAMRAAKESHPVSE